MWQTAQKEIISRKFFFIATPLAIIYALCTLYLFNYRLITQTVLGNYTISYKFSLLSALLPGFLTLFSPFDLFLLIVTSLLVGINFMVALSSIQRIKKQGRVTLSVGGASIIGLAAAGCGTCGLSLFALFGLSTAVSSLPFHGLELHLLALLLLSFSLGYMLKKLNEEIYCKIPKSTKEETK
jgi:hypothetical protein